MPNTFTQGEIFDKNIFLKNPLNKGEYEDCIFKNCNFIEAKLSSFEFIDCEFHDCELSLAKINRTSFQNTSFINCKMLGLRFDHCNSFGFSVSFDGCLLNHVSFYNMEIKNTVFKNTRLKESDFTEADFTGTIFDNCDFEHAIFHNTILEKSDFRTSYNYIIDPEENKLKKAKFSIIQAAGLLNKYGIELY